MDNYQSFIALSRYARWLDDENRRETWEETVLRYINFFRKRFDDLLFPDETDEHSTYFWSDMAKAILELEVMPSMRALMTAGPALERDNMAGFNPVTGDTRIITKEFGTVPIASLEGKAATVLNKGGRWAEADFRGYGLQPIYKVTARLNSNTVKEVKCTSNHRWVKQDGTVVATTNLIKGDRIDFVSAPKPAIDADYRLGIMHGLVYGDGTTAKACGRVRGYIIRLCGEDNRELLKYFDGYPITYPPSANGDPLVQMYDDFAATHALKALPSEKETDSYLLGFVRGWLAADGSVGKTHQISLCVAGEGLEWLRANAERIGFTIQGTYKQSSETNYGKRKQDSWVVRFSRSSMTTDDFLCSWKRENFKPLKSHWVVSEVKEEGYEDRVYCAEVEDTNTFVLEGGLVTGNCSYIAIDDPRAFDELMYILMCGTGVGFSVERQYVTKLPEVADELHETNTVIKVKDSKIGWASSLRELISLLYSGRIPVWDLSKIRPSGARLKTFGGRASGPEPLDALFKFCIRIFKQAIGRRLTSLECHDLCCKIADVVVVGGVRRSALISLSNLSDDRMRRAKMGQWWEENEHRALANNSACYTERPDFESFLKEWVSMYESRAGERGIFSRVAARKIAERNGRRDVNHEFGTNPCSEIILRPNQVCNLSEVVVRATDTLDYLKRKVRIATILGTMQATLTKFRYLRPIWRKNTEEEALLGVSLTGIMDHPTMAGLNGEHKLSEWLRELRIVAVDTNADWASRLGINQSAAITCVN